jgi:hypothetical protein
VKSPWEEIFQERGIGSYLQVAAGNKSANVCVSVVKTIYESKQNNNFEERERDSVVLFAGGGRGSNGTPDPDR